MTFVQLAAPVLALALLAAHFYRGEHFVLVAVSLAAALCVFVRRPWAARAIQAMLALGALEWVRTGIELAQMRAGRGEPFLRLALILGAVALFTALAALLPQTRALRAHFRLGPAAP